MKKIVLGLCSLVLIGAGCAPGSTQVADSDWWLALDLPEDWVMVAHYGDKVPDPTSVAITSAMSDVVVQSTALPIELEGEQLDETIEAFVSEDYTYIRIFRYDDRKVIPSEATDLGDGFYYDDSGEGESYWYEGEYGKYRFHLTIDSQDRETASDVILSAQEQNLTN